MALDLFTLMGRIAIDSGNSKSEIEEITESAKNLSGKLNASSTKTENAASKIGKATVFW